MLRRKQQRGGSHLGSAVRKGEKFWTPHNMLQAIVAETFFLFFSHTRGVEKRNTSCHSHLLTTDHTLRMLLLLTLTRAVFFSLWTPWALLTMPHYSKKNRSNFPNISNFCSLLSPPSLPTLSSSPSSFLHIGAERHGKSSKRARVAAPATTLEQAVFGGAAKVLGADLYSAASAAADSDGDDAAAAAGPAWVDDDDAGLSVDVVSKPRARKLRADEAEKALKGNVYAGRLKTQFEKVKK